MAREILAGLRLARSAPEEAKTNAGGP